MSSYTQSNLILEHGSCRDGRDRRIRLAERYRDLVHSLRSADRDLAEMRLIVAGMYCLVLKLDQKQPNNTSKPYICIEACTSGLFQLPHGIPHVPFSAKKYIYIIHK